MLIKKGFPEEGELLLCTVTKIFGHAVFVNIEEYNRQGMIHISEISPGRIRNLRDFVVEGKKIVCAVLRVNQEKGYIDLSLRRVNENQKRIKSDSIKQEQKAEKIVEFVAKEIHKDPKQFYDHIIEKVLKKYPNLSSCFSDIINENISLKDLGIDGEAASKLIEMVKERMKPPKSVISGKLLIKSYDGNGVDIIKEALKKTQDIGKDAVDIKYMGGGSYNIVVTAPDYKPAEKILKQCVDFIDDFMKKKGGTVEFVRKETKK